MSDRCQRFQVRSLRDAELLSGLLALVKRGNQLMAEMLLHLVEIDQRMLFAELGFPSLFAYCVESLGMSEGAAGRRCAAARVCRRFPEAFEHVARGHLHLSALCGLSKYLTPQNAAELFEACTGKTRRQVDEVLAARFPRPLVREMLRRLPERSLPLPANTLPSSDRVQTETRLKAGALERQPDHAYPKELGTSDIPSRESRPTAEAPSRAIASATTQTSVVRLRGQELEPLAVDRYKVQFTADGKLRELIERASTLCGHSAPNEIAKVITRALQLFVQHEEKRRFSIGAKPRTSNRDAQTGARAISRAKSGSTGSTPPGGVTPQSASTKPRSRHVPVEVRREVYMRDHGRCSFVAKDGRRCNARARLELDHVEPWARMGANEPSNIRLRCRAHNLLHAKHCFGTLHLAAKVAARQREARCRAARSAQS
jgi:hypothetical protein